MRSKASRASRSGMSSGMPWATAGAGLLHRGEHPVDVDGVDFARQRSDRQRAHHVVELRQVARPVEVAQLVQGGRRESPHRADAGLDQLRQHEVGDLGHVFAMLAQGRHLDGQAGQTVIQPAVEFARRHHGVEAAAGGAHQARAAAFDAVEQQSQALLLQTRQFAGIGQIEGAVAERLDKAQRVGHQARAILDFDPRTGGLVQEMGADLEAAAGFAQQQDRRSVAGDLGEAFFEFEDQRAAAERRQVHAGRPPRQGHAALDRLADGVDQLGQRNRFFQEVGGAELGGLDGGIDGAVAGHHHHRHGELAAARPFLQQRHAVGVGHPDVEQDQIRTAQCAKGTRRLGVFRQVHVIALVGQDFRQQLTNAHFVVDDENMPAHVCSPTAAKTGSADADDGTARFEIFDLDFTVMLFDDFFDDGQAQAGSLGLGGCVWLEQPRHQMLRKPGSIVRYGQTNCVVVEARADLDTRCGVTGQRILRILQQIMYHLTQ